MIKVYAVLLVLGFIAILIIVMGGALAENLGRSDRDPGEVIGDKGRSVVGSVLGFSMGGMAAEFSPLDFSWQVALIIALVAGVIGALWVRYATRLSNEG